jgi:signal transduction histidine kinase
MAQAPLDSVFDPPSEDFDVTSSPAASSSALPPSGEVLRDRGGVAAIGPRQGALERSQRLLEVTAAIAEAVDVEQVLDAVVERMATALGASSVGLWFLSDDGLQLNLVRSVGYGSALMQAFESCRLDQSPAFPAVDAIRTNAPIWLSSPLEFVRAYPHLAALVSPTSRCSLACLPLVVRDSARGCIAFSFEGDSVLDSEERDFLLLVARYAGQAVQRLHLLETERALRAANEQGRLRAQLLYELAARVIGAKTVEEVFGAALDGIERALGASRCSILTFDTEHVMRFRAWRGLSEEYRRAVEGHTPWARQCRDPQPIVVPDVRKDESLSSFARLFDEEKIGALGFIPLVYEQRLVGKFMVYYPEPHALSVAGLEMARAIANHVAAAIGRFSTLRELEQTVRFNEIFTGMLGHDLRNPLGAIMAAAQMAVRRSEGGPLEKPLARIIKSGGRMATMIDQLLDFTRVRVGAGIPIDPQPADLAQLVKQAMDELSDAYPDWRFSFETDIEESSGVWDADRIVQVFSNLVANAVQHATPDPGVSVRIEGRAPGAVSVLIHNMGVVPAEVLPRLFEPMAGGDRRRDNSRGLGLGLYISREIVSAHGGTIDVETSAHSGTTFTVRLPRKLPIKPELDA